MSSEEEKDLERATAALAKNTEGLDKLLANELTIFAIDCSSSMDDNIGIGGAQISKMEAAKKALKEFFRRRLENQTKNPDLLDQIAVVQFPAKNAESNASVVLHPSLPSAKLETCVDALAAKGGTPMAAAFRTITQIVEAAPLGLIRMVVISDGTPYDRSMALQLATTLANDFGIVIDAVGVGDQLSQFSYDEAFMRNLAELGQGRFFHVSDFTSLSNFLLSQEASRRALMGAGMLLLPAAPKEE